MPSEGWVYIIGAREPRLEYDDRFPLSNSGLPLDFEPCKIGYTTRHPNTRVNEIELPPKYNSENYKMWNNGVTPRLKVLHSIKTNDVVFCEQWVHFRYGGFHGYDFNMVIPENKRIADSEWFCLCHFDVQHLKEIKRIDITTEWFNYWQIEAISEIIEYRIKSITITMGERYEWHVDTEHRIDWSDKASSFSDALVAKTPHNPPFARWAQS